jgi:predicted Zn-dependent protease
VKDPGLRPKEPDLSKHPFLPPRLWRPSGLALALAAALATASAPVAQAQVNLPALGDSVSEDLDINAENRLGERIMMEIRQDPDYLDDPVLSDYIRSIWQPLVQAAQDAGYLEPDRARLFAWETFEVREKSINAFALPGGHVACTWA